MNYDHPFYKCLEEHNIDWRNLQDYNFIIPGLLIGTFHGTKGLESNIIIIPEINKYISNDVRQLLYVWITVLVKK